MDEFEVFEKTVTEDLEREYKKHLIIEKNGGDKYTNSDGTFKNGFEGCVSKMKSEGKSEDSARRICAYIGRKAGKI